MLTDTRVRHAKPAQRPIKLSDADGLHLLVQPHGSKLWRMAYRFAGKQKTLALGIYPTVGLQEAREKRDAAKRLLAKGLDPSMQRRLEREAARAPGSTFTAVAEELMAKLERECRAVATLTKKRWLLQFAYPSIGHRPVSEITAPELLWILRRVEDRGCYETAQRLRSTFGTVFRYAIATGSCYVCMKKFHLKAGQSGSFDDHPDNSQDHHLPWTVLSEGRGSVAAPRRL